MGELDFLAIAGNCHGDYQRHFFAGDERCKHCGKRRPRKGELYCHRCGYRNIIHESLAEGYSCPACGCSDTDE